MPFLGGKIANFGFFQKINSNGFFNRISKIINFLLYISFKYETKTQIALFPFLIKYYKLTGAFLNIIDFNLIDDILSVWILMGIFIVISVILYIGTCLLYDKKVNL